MLINLERKKSYNWYRLFVVHRSSTGQDIVDNKVFFVIVIWRKHLTLKRSFVTHEQTRKAVNIVTSLRLTTPESSHSLTPGLSSPRRRWGFSGCIGRTKHNHTNCHGSIKTAEEVQEDRGTRHSWVERSMYPPPQATAHSQGIRVLDEC